MWIKFYLSTAVLHKIRKSCKHTARRLHLEKLLQYSCWNYRAGKDISRTLNFFWNPKVVSSLGLVPLVCLQIGKTVIRIGEGLQKKVCIRIFSSFIETRTRNTRVFSRSFPNKQRVSCNIMVYFPGKCFWTKKSSGMNKVSLV